MPRLDPDAWERIRIARESSGESFKSLAERFGVSVGAIHKRAKREGWGDGTDVGAVIRRRVNARVNGIHLDARDHEARAAAIDAAAERGADVLHLHRQDWAKHRARFGSEPENMNEARLGKLAAEMLRARQEGERKAWGLDADEGRAEIVIERRGC